MGNKIRCNTQTGVALAQAYRDSGKNQENFCKKFGKHNKQVHVVLLLEEIFGSLKIRSH